MIIRKVGVTFLGAGFLMLAVAVLIRDSTALDANIGAGVLSLVGIPVGVLGLAVTAGHALYMSWRERKPRRR